MKRDFLSNYRWIAVPGLVAGLFYSWLILSIFLPRPPGVVVIIIGFTWLISLLSWILGLSLWHKNELRITGWIGLALTVTGTVLIGHWLFQSDFILSHAQSRFSFRTAIAMILFSSGILLFGSALLRVGKLSRFSILLWTVGLLLGNAGIAHRWAGYLFMVAIGLFAGSAFIWKEKIPQIAGNGANASQLSGRFLPLDLLRGLIMILMALDHASIYVLNSHAYEVWNIAPTSYFAKVGTFYTRFITHFCAPGFFFLMGAGMILFSNSRVNFGWTHNRIRYQLIIRGIALILLEKLLWTPILFGTFGTTRFGVLYGLGAAMILGSFCIRLDRRYLLFFGILALVITQFLPQLFLDTGLSQNPLIILLFVPNSYHWFSIYPALPWLGIALLGMVFGKTLLTDSQKSFKRIGLIGLLCLIVFPFMRYFGGFGNFQPLAGTSLINYLNVIKYPPSLAFVLITLGVNFVLLFLFDRFQSGFKLIGKPLSVFGKTALFFYFAHWFLYPVFGLPFYFISGRLLYLYLGWVVGLLILFPVCLNYLSFKQTTNHNSLWRMI